MESGEIYRIGSCHSTRDDVFSKGSREEDDEEALRWAALERLPTYNRLRKGVLIGGGDGGEAKEVDVQKLSMGERKSLMERLVRVAEEDNERFLFRLKERIERVRISLPTIEVRFENLNVEAKAYIGSRALPTVFNTTVNILEGFLNHLRVLPSKKKTLSILNDVRGIVKPYRMTLLLGPPSSGKTTLLKALAGKLDSDLKVSGRITYNGHQMNEFIPQRASVYISQYDVHIAELTVRETLAFSARCQGVGSSYEMLKELVRREKEAHIVPDTDVDIYMKAAFLEGQEESVVTDYILKILGLDICADTIVGDAMRRGVSGGQRKRVTTGEMLVGPARALFMDEISTGLDSSTTFQIVNSLRQSIHIIGGTAVISLLQPAPETYDLFDDIILLSNGYIVYQGPRERVLEFFESMGFRCPERKGTADFLQEVTSRKDQQQYWARLDEPYRYIPVKELANAFRLFPVGQELNEELSIPFDKSKSHPAALTKTNYGVNKKELLKACLWRELLLMRRNSFVHIFKMAQLIITGFIVMSVFFHTKMPRDSVEDGGVYLGALFVGVTTIMFNGLAELPMTLKRLPVFYKQRDLLFYPSWAYSLPTWILKIPMSCIEAAIWVAITYYGVGYDPSVKRFFKQYLLLVMSNQMASGLFRAIAAVGSSIIISNTLASFVFVVMAVLGGFIMSRDYVKKAWIWGYWVSPLMYAQNAIAINEFLGNHWKKVLPGSTESLGKQVLKARGIFTESYWYWIGVGAMVGFTLLFNGVFSIALAYLNSFEKVQAVLSEEAYREQIVNRTGEDTATAPSGTRNGSSKTTSGSTSGKRQTHIVQQKRRGMILPFSPLSITFDDIKYSVDMPQEMKAHGVDEDKLVLLKGVSGAFRPGVLTALMGVSGAGKTTLMDVLAGRKTSGYVEGSIKISGYPKKQETFARVCGYCEQNDIHSPCVTVYESVLYSAWLRLPAEIDSTTRKMFFEEVIELVELTPLKGSLVGLPGISGLSTEQRKRLTVAVELVANPSIIFMDEPTSGLDARAAAIVMRTVRNTVDTGRTVVCTIHQPSMDIFESFDELFLLKRGGEEIYVGPLGRQCCQLIEYFQAIDGVSKIKEGYNPATWMLEVTTEAQENILGINFADVYKDSDLFRRNKALIKELSKPTPGSSDLHFATKYPQSFLTQCMACLWKQYWSYWRNPAYTAMRFFLTTVIAFILGTIFWGLGSKRNRKQDLFNAMGSLHISVVFIGTQNASSVQPVVNIERTVFYREKAARMYSAIPYALAQVAIEIPYIFIQALTYGIIVYSMMGYEHSAIKFFEYLFLLFFTFLSYTYFGMMVVAMTPDLNISSTISSAFFSLWSLFSGLTIPRLRIPVWWRWYPWASPISWTLYGLLSSQFGDVQSTLESGETVAEFIRSYFGFRYDFLGVVCIVIFGFTVLFAIIFAYSIKVFNFQRR